MTNKAVIIGAGALGSHIVLLARNWPIEFQTEIRVVDFDRIEARNLLGQFHTKPTVGQNKAVAIQRMLKTLFGSEIEARSHALRPENVGVTFEQASLIIDATDNAEARSLIRTGARERPLLHCGMSASGAYGIVAWGDQFPIEKETPGQPTCLNGRALPFHALVASQAVLAAQMFLVDGKQYSYSITPTGIIRI